MPDVFLFHLFVALRFKAHLHCGNIIHFGDSSTCYCDTHFSVDITIGPRTHFNGDIKILKMLLSLRCKRALTHACTYFYVTLSIYPFRTNSTCLMFVLMLMFSRQNRSFNISFLALFSSSLNTLLLGHMAGNNLTSKQSSFITSIGKSHKFANRLSGTVYTKIHFTFPVLRQHTNFRLMQIIKTLCVIRCLTRGIARKQ